jgi:hypothetical protein
LKIFLKKFYFGACGVGGNPKIPHSGGLLPGCEVGYIANFHHNFCPPEVGGKYLPNFNRQNQEEFILAFCQKISYYRTCR